MNKVNKYISIVVAILVIISFIHFTIAKNKVKPINAQAEAISIEIPFKYQIVSGNKAIETCLQIKRELNITPVIFGGKENVEFLFESEAEESPEKIIEKSKQFNINHFIKSRTDQDPELYTDSELMGEWPKMGVQKFNNLTAPTDILSGKPLKEVFIGHIPTSNSYEVPAYLNYGGWNECPLPEEHVGIWRYWHEKYGAEIISVTSDVIECTVKNPPKTKEEALILAKEQFFYCSDIVTQGTGTISTLAACLIDSKYWYFWWD